MFLASTLLALLAVSGLADLGPVPTGTLRVYLVRHGQSEANLDKTVNARLPDHRVELSPEGHRQAATAGEYLTGALPPEARNGVRSRYPLPTSACLTSPASTSSSWRRANERIGFGFEWSLV
jgi:broad specificity phosphatase PhoE